jgi:hypothetical protein
VNVLGFLMATGGFGLSGHAVGVFMILTCAFRAPTLSNAIREKIAENFMW